MPTPIPLALVGGGVMAQAIVRGGIDAGTLDPRLIGVAEPDGVRRDTFRAAGIRAFKAASELCNWLASAESSPGRGQLLLAIKPQMLPEAAAQYAPLLASRPRTIISILAGISSSRIRAALGPAHGIVRVMPNTASRIRKGCAAICLGAGAGDGDDALAISIFTSLGRVIHLDESMFDAFTAVSASGPAYLFYLAESMTRAAIHVGFPPDAAASIVRWTIAGAAALYDSTDQPPEALRAAVTSKGGTTAAATAVLDQAAMHDIVTRAIAAARDRGAELGRTP